MARRKQPPERSDTKKIKDPVEKAFMRSLRECEAYIRLEKQMGLLIFEHGVDGSGKISNEEFEKLLQPFCKACWEESERSFSENSNSGFYAIARKDADSSKKNLNECNLNCMKQIVALKSRGDEEKFQPSVTFYEPLQYLDPEIRELVLLIVADKVRDLKDGTAPAALVEEVKAVETEAPKKRRSIHNMVAPEPNKEKIGELQEEVADLQHRVEEVEAKCDKIEALREIAEQHAEEAEAKRIAEAEAAETEGAFAVGDDVTALIEGEWFPGTIAVVSGSGGGALYTVKWADPGEDEPETDGFSAAELKK